MRGIIRVIGEVLNGGARIVRALGGIGKWVAGVVSLSFWII